MFQKSLNYFENYNLEYSKKNLLISSIDERGCKKRKCFHGKTIRNSLPFFSWRNKNFLKKVLKFFIFVSLRSNFKIYRSFLNAFTCTVYLFHLKCLFHVKVLCFFFVSIIYLSWRQNPQMRCFLSDWSSFPQMDTAWNPLKCFLLSLWSHLWLRHAGEVMHQLWNDFSEINLREIHQHVELKLTKNYLLNPFHFWVYWILIFMTIPIFYRWYTWISSILHKNDSLMQCIDFFLLYTDHVLICEVDRLFYFLNDVYIYVVSKMTFFVTNHKKMSFLI